MENLYEVIKKYCKWCMGGEKELIEKCDVKDCPLYKVKQDDKTLLKAIQNKCIDCAGSIEDIKDCNAYKNNPDGVDVCPLWEYRLKKT